MIDQTGAIAAPSILETAEYRVDGRAKVTGAARYAADITRPGMLWAGFRRSDLPHARIVSIGIDEARKHPEVHAVLTAADIGAPHFGRRLLDQPVLATGRVRFIGERIAAVAAESREAAEWAAQLIEVEYEELPPVFGPSAALLPDAPVLHPDRDEYIYLGGQRPVVPHPNIQGRLVVHTGDGDIRAAFDSAVRVFEHTFTTPRHHHGYIEPHACLVWIGDDGVIHVISTNKAPFNLRQQMSRTFETPVEQIDVDSGFIGGDFGGKGYSPDEYACYYLAAATGRPVKAVMSYVDELSAANPRHAATIRLRTGIDDDGRFVAHEARVVFDGGAYAAAKPLPTLVLSGGVQTLGAYRVPSSSIEVLTVYTNTAPGGHMRSPGEVQALFAGESHVDIIAREMGVDPVEFRLRNVLRDGEAGPTGERPRQVRGTELLKTLQQEASTRSGPRDGRGRGVAIGLRHIGGGKIGLVLTLDAAGTVTALTGIADQGGGAHTVIQRVVAAVMSIDPDSVRVRRESTRTAPSDPGVGGSRITHLASQAATRAAASLKKKVETAASSTLGDGTQQIMLVDGWLVGARETRRVLLADAAKLLVGAEGVMSAEGTYEAARHGDNEPADFNFGACMAEVTVDPETGQVTVLDVTYAVDVGTVINPVGHKGQLEGGFAFGIGGALMEEMVLEDGKVTTANLGDYKLPTSMDVPPLRAVLLPAERGPGAFGAKMAGELTNAAVAPAIANAIADAVGVRLYALPLSAERVHASLRELDRNSGPSIHSATSEP